MPLVVLDCGSISTSNTLRPATARYVDRLIAVVVFPTPPFWFAIAYTFATGRFHTFHLTMPACCSISCYCMDIVTNASIRSNCELTHSPITPYNQNRTVCLLANY